MDGKGCSLFCEAHHAARILGVEYGKVEKWITGGLLLGTFSNGRWLADIESVRNLHVKFHRERKLGFRPFIAECSKQRICDRIAELNLKLTDSAHTPKRAKSQRNMIEYIESLCIVALPGQRPPGKRPPGGTHSRTSGRTPRHRSATIKSRRRLREKEITRKRNARAYEIFQENRAARFGDGRLPSIADKRFWWNEE